MTVQSFAESVVKEAALARLESAGRQGRDGAEIAPGESTAELDDYGQLVLARRLRESLPPLVCGDVRLKAAEKFIVRAV